MAQCDRIATQRERLGGALFRATSTRLSNAHLGSITELMAKYAVARG